MIRTYRLISLILLLLATVSVRAETLDCTAITSLPYVITTQGIYCLTGNLSTSMTSGNAIEIQTNNVTIDLNGYKLGGLGAGDGTQARGIYSSQRKNITIKNGTIRGFRYGIYLDGGGSNLGSGHVVQDIRADGNTQAGIYVTGTSSVVRNNQVVDSGGTTISTNAFAIGIRVAGPGSQVMDNQVADTHATGSGDAYSILVVNMSDGTVVQGNRVSNISLPASGTSYGIYAYGNAGSTSHNVAISHNIIAEMTIGIEYGTYASGLYAHNIVMNCGTAFSGGGTAAGSTNYFLP